MEAKEEKKKPLPAESALSDHSHTMIDRTAEINLIDVAGVSFLESPRACLGKYAR